MAKYFVHFKTNEAAWPTDPGEVAATWEGVLAGAQQTLDLGLVEALYWVSPIEGYALGEFGSKAEAIQMCVPFFPLFNQEVIELTPHAEASQAIVAGMKMATSADS